MKKSSIPHEPPRLRSFALLVVLCSFAAGLLFFIFEHLLVILSADTILSPFVRNYRVWLLLAFSGVILFAIIRRYGAALKRDEETIAHLAHYDTVTRLPNRQSFQGRLEQALIEARLLGGEVEVSYLDLDRFRTIVRTLGLSVAQNLLCDVAERLSKAMGEGEFLAHAGGDEFMVLASESGPPDKAKGLASRLLESIRAPFAFDGQELHLAVSIGIAIYPHDGEDSEALLKNAYAAMNRAKEMGGNHYQFYFSDLSEYSTLTLLLENRLRRALEEEEFVPLYQPQVSLADGRITGMEVLVSWKHPAHPGVTPSEFIPLAEESGLIEPIGEWILRTACLQNRRWQLAGLPPLRVAVNVSARQFCRSNLVELVKEVLGVTGLEARWLALEITETVLMQDVEETINTLNGLKEIGVHVTVDDFGTGYSSLSYLKRFPIQTLKLDKSFVTGIPVDADATAITAAVIAMAHAMSLSVVAEGVEREEQWAYLVEKGCDEVQGYLVSRPLTAEQFAVFLRR
jgi:diguanylate cyclase (GGDEF)-like protein